MIRCLKLLILLSLLAALVYFGHGFALDRAGRYLIVKDELRPADVIVVLGGEATERVEHGVKLFKEGWARKDRIVMTGGPLVARHTWAALMKEHAEELGLPGKNILLVDRSRSTEEDAEFTRDLMLKHGYKSLILVTSPYHSRRASMYFRKVMGGRVAVINSPAEPGWLRFEEWWKRRRDRDMVLNEFSKLIRLWIFGSR